MLFCCTGFLVHLVEPHLAGKLCSSCRLAAPGLVYTTQGYFWDCRIGLARLGRDGPGCSCFIPDWGVHDPLDPEAHPSVGKLAVVRIKWITSLASSRIPLEGSAS